MSQWLPWAPVAAILHFALLVLGSSHVPSPQPQPDFGPAIEVVVIRTSAAEPHPDVTDTRVPAASAAAAPQPPAPAQPKAANAHSQIKPQERRPTAAAAKSPQQPPLAPSRVPRKQNTGDSSHAELPQPATHQTVEPVSSPATTASTVATASTAATATVAKPRFPGKTARDTRSYLSQIAAWIDANKRYPTAAKKVKEEGVVLIRFSIDRNGNLLASSIKQSSGHSRLDQSALATLARAAPFPPIPEFIDSDTLSIAVPIDYSLITD